MGLGKMTTAFRGALSTRQTLQLAKFYLEYACKTTDHDIAQLLCHDAKSALSHVKRASKWAPKYTRDQGLRQDIAAAYSELGRLQDDLGLADQAQANYKIAEEFGYVIDRSASNRNRQQTSSD